MYARPFLIGLASLLPAARKLFARKGTGAPVSPEYYYGVWLKHLTMLWESGMRAMPHTMAELGPGDTLGVGIAALLSGVRRYYALDVVEYCDRAANARIFDALVELFRSRAPRPARGWPDIDEYLDQRLFPSHILSESLLDKTLAPARVAAIREALLEGRAFSDDGPVVKYIVPWDEKVVAPGSVDLVVSHVVLQAVRDLERTYAALAQWLARGGWMSHHIDFTSQRTARAWNGHWAYGETTWKLIAGKRPSLTNREPHSTHIALMRKNGFEIVRDMQRYREAEALPREALASRWRGMTEDDRICESALIHARKV